MITVLTISARRRRESDTGRTNSRNIKKQLKRHTSLVGFVLTLGNPYSQEGITADPKKTIIVGRLNYDTTEEKLKEEFSLYGDIKMVRLIKDKSGHSRGYAFIEFYHKRDFLCSFC